jgi:hypothetical protein
MDVRHHSDIRTLLAVDGAGPRLTVCQPVNGLFPDIQKDVLRFRNLFGLFRDSLAERYRRPVIEEMLAPFVALAGDAPFWDHSFRGLAVFSAAGTFHALRLCEPVAERAVYADTFYLKSVIEQYQTADHFQVLSLSKKGVRLFQGQRHQLLEVPLHASIPRRVTDLPAYLPEPEASSNARHGHQALNENLAPQAAHHRGLGSKDYQDQDTDIVDPEMERFAQVVDERVTAHHSRPTGWPLLVAATPENQAILRRVSKNPYLLDERIDAHVGTLNASEIAALAWNAMRGRYEVHWRARRARYSAAAAKGLASDLAQDVARAAAEGRVEMLMIEHDKRAEGQIEPEEELAKPSSRDHREVDTLIDAIGQLALRNGAELIVVPPEQTPSVTGLAAILRYSLPPV